jgi:hypothetical protein
MGWRAGFLPTLQGLPSSADSFDKLPCRAAGVPSSGPVDHWGAGPRQEQRGSGQVLPGPVEAVRTAEALQSAD